jgi:hypothetical protein
MLSRPDVARDIDDAYCFVVALSFPLVGDTTSVADKHKISSFTRVFQLRKANGTLFVPFTQCMLCWSIMETVYLTAWQN